MNLNKISILFTVLLLFVLGFSFENVFAEELETIEFEILYTNGDIADFNDVSVIVYQDLENIPILEKNLESNPDFISVPENYRYKIEIYTNGIYADVGYVQLNTLPEKIKINIPISGGLKFNVFYEDGQTPIEGATVVIKSQDNKEWKRLQTNEQGDTIRTWIQSTVKQEDHYIADVYIGDIFLTSHYPIKLQPGLTNDQKITTPIPEIIKDLITISLYKDGTNKVTHSDGSYEITLTNSYSEIMLNSKVNYRGDAHFSSIVPGVYTATVTSENPNEDALWNKIDLEIMGDVSNFNIFKTHSIQEIISEKIDTENVTACNCVAFRFDDVQDHWLSATQIEIINLFNEKNIPLTIGVIGSLFGFDDNLTSTILNNIENDVIEVANHSWDNQPLINFEYEEQEKLILDTQQNIQEVLNVKPEVFIPPQNLYNLDTIDVLKNNGFNHISSHLEETHEIEVDNENFYKVPAVIETGILVDDTQWEFIDIDFINVQIEKSIKQNGYAIVMMHPQEFSLDENGGLGQPNEEYIQELSRLLDELSESDSPIVPISSIVPLPEELRIPHGAISETCNCVAFRLDDVQDYWLNDVQIGIMELFDKNNVPLTIAIIANTFGNDPKISEHILENTGNLEIASKGLDLVPFTNFNKDEQDQKLAQSLDKIEDDLKIRPNVFIPPNNKFNSDTLEVLSNNGITHFSSSITKGDNPPFELKNSELYRFPEISTTGIYDNDLNMFVGRSSDLIIQEVEQGLGDYGFAVVTMHPQEFSSIEEGTYANSINPNQLDELNTIITTLKEKKYNIVTIGNINLDSSINIPSWVKDNAEWWAEGQIDDKTFGDSIEYIIQENIIAVSEESQEISHEKNVPLWIKNNAEWWADGQIDDKTFVDSIEYLVKNGIITY